MYVCVGVRVCGCVRESETETLYFTIQIQWLKIAATVEGSMKLSGPQYAVAIFGAGYCGNCMGISFHSTAAGHLLAQSDGELTNVRSRRPSCSLPICLCIYGIG